MTTIELLRDEASFYDLETQWNELSEASEYPNIFTTFDWQSTWLQYFGQELNGELFLLAVRDESSRLIGIAPFYRRGRRLTWIGFGGRTCPEYLGPIVRKGFVEPVVAEIVRFLKENPKEWNSIFIEDYALDDPASVRLAELLGKEFAEHSGSGETRLTITFTGDYDAYLATLSYNSRRQRRKRFNQAATRFGARIEYLEAGAEAEDIDRVFSILVQLTTEARTRHGEANPFHETVYAGFHRALLERLLPKHRAVLALLYLNEKPAAIWYCFLLGKKCYAYQQGFSPEFEGSPSDVCQQFLIRRLTEEHYEEFDYLRGREAYKESVANGQRETRWAFFFRTRGVGYAFRLFLDRVIRPVYRRLRFSRTAQTSGDSE